MAIVTNKNVVMACHITGIFDVNRQSVLPNDNYLLIKDWADSIINLKMNGIVFHNNLSDETCQTYQNEFITFIKINHNKQFNPNVYRYIIYDNYLQNAIYKFENIFITDVSDVVVVQNPFLSVFYLQNPDSIFCGDEPKLLNNDWMIEHNQHIRSTIPNFEDFENLYSNANLLNCGIIGGNFSLMKAFISKLATLHCKYNYNNKTEFTGDMGVFNYLMRKEYSKNLLHGKPINTVFKEYETLRNDCWFRHK